jgi:dTDP-4-amino-4,6-dideoxygalactose transaminase
MKNTRELVFSPWPCFSQEEVDAVTRVLISNKVNYWTGDECKKFEREFANWCQSKYAIALANGTVALDLALTGLNVGAGDEVIVTSRTFIASASCIANAGATPIFADVDRDSQNITVETIESKISSRTKAIICVHLAGWPCDMDSIMSLAEKYNLYVIEDCAQAHGAMYKGKPVGGIGHVGSWSFCQDKIMTTGGEGGMVTCNDEMLWSRMWSSKEHGKNWEEIVKNRTSDGFSWIHDSFGGNGRMTEMQAAIGRIQLGRMSKWHARRKANAEKLITALSESRLLRIPVPPSDVEHAWYKFTVFLCPDNLATGWGRERIMKEINSLGITCRVGPCPEVYLEKAFDDTGYRPEKRLENAKELGDTSLMFLVHPTLSENEIELMADNILNVVKLAENK